MRPIAENHITISKKLYHEGMNAVVNKKNQRTLRIAMIIAILIFAAFGISNAVRGGSPLMIVGELIFIAILAVWVFYFMPRSNINSKYKLMTHNAGGEPQRSVTFYEDSFTVYAEGGRTINVSYKNVKDIKETANLYIILVKDQPGVMVDKNGFTSGSMEIVKAAIEKIPKPKKQTIAEIAKGTYDQD